MVRKSVYIELSISGYLTARPSCAIVSLARQILTLEWWEASKPAFMVFISEALLEEIAQGDRSAIALCNQAILVNPVASLTN